MVQIKEIILEIILTVNMQDIDLFQDAFLTYYLPVSSTTHVAVLATLHTSTLVSSVAKINQQVCKTN